MILTILLFVGVENTDMYHLSLRQKSQGLPMGVK
jgi:hypothetical protein